MMKPETKKAIRAIKKRLEQTISLHSTACGYDMALAVAFQAEEDLIELIRDELVKRDNGTYQIPQTRLG